MMAKKRSGLVYLLVLWIVISGLAWPAFVGSATVLSHLGGEGWQLDAWSQIPKSLLLQHFLDGYRQSLIIALPVGLVAVIDYLLLSRYRITWWLAGILMPVTGAALALYFFTQAANALPTLVLTGVVLAIVHRLVDLMAGSASRGRLR
ncbi:MAG: hypothetical protein HKN42_18660 [Granulosicoccus sp.]|nr:hypothetical protein [Granulosicoccus sp.]